MVQLSTDERHRIQTLIECIAEALSRCDGMDVQYANRTKVQKLLYLAIDEYDIPITYSWYLAGAVLPDDSGTPAELQSAFDDLTSPETLSVPDRTDDTDDTSTDKKSALDSLVGAGDTTAEDTIDPVLFTDDSETGDESTELASPSDVTAIAEEIVAFYMETIPDVWHQDTMRFLQNFYDTHAPEQYRDLYIQSTHLRIRLRESKKAVAAYATGEEPNADLGELFERIQLNLTDLHLTIRQTTTLQETFDGFLHGTNLIEDGLMMLVHHAPALTQQHVDIVESMEDFFYYSVWRYPCLVISSETALGPSEDALREERRERLAGFEDELRDAAADLERNLDAAGLLPAYDDYEPSGDDIDERIRELAEQYLE